MISINVTKYFGNKKIIENFECTLKKGYIYRLEGQNGSGKSTLFSILYKLDKQYEGYVKFNGKDINNINDNYWRNNNITYISQKSTLLQGISFIENLNILIPYYDKGNLDILLNKFSINHIKNSKYKDLSGGEKQKCEIVLGLLKENNIILLDEVDRNLDKESLVILNEIIQAQKKSKIILVVSHFEKNLEYDSILDIAGGKQLDIDKMPSDSIGEENRKGRILKPYKMYWYYFKDNLKIKLLLSLIIFTFLLFQAIIVERTIDQYYSHSMAWGDVKKYDNEIVMYAPFINLSQDTPLLKQVAEDTDNLFFEENDMEFIEGIENVTSVKQSFIPYVNTSVDEEGFEVNEKVDGDTLKKIDEQFFKDFDIKEYSSNASTKISSDYTSMYMLESREVLKKSNYLFHLSGDVLYGDIPEDSSNEIAVPISYAASYQYLDDDNELSNIIGKEISINLSKDGGEKKEEKFKVSGVVTGYNFIYPYDENNATIKRLREKNFPYENKDKTDNYKTEYANYENMIDMINSNYLLGLKKVSYDEFVKGNPDLIKGFYIDYENEEDEEEIYNSLVEKYPNSIIYSNYIFENGASNDVLHSYMVDKVLKSILLSILFLIMIFIVLFKYFQENINRNYSFRFYGYSLFNMVIGNVIENIQIYTISVLFMFIISIYFQDKYLLMISIILSVAYMMLLLLLYPINNFIYINKRKKKNDFYIKS